MCHAVAQAGDRQDFQALRAAAARFVADRAALAYPGTRTEVEAGPIDARLQLPTCPQPEFALSAGSTLWGSGNLAVSCAAPAWSLYLTYRTTIAGPALLTRRPLPAGIAPGPTDLIKGEVEYAGDPDRYLRDPASLRGGALTRPLAKNSPITIDMLRILPTIRPGQRVRIVVEGQGFQISQEGIAQSQAGIGEALRLKIASGRFVQGTVQPDGTVRVRP